MFSRIRDEKRLLDDVSNDSMKEPRMQDRHGRTKHIDVFECYDMTRDETIESTGPIADTVCHPLAHSGFVPNHEAAQILSKSQEGLPVLASMESSTAPKLSARQKSNEVRMVL